MRNVGLPPSPRGLVDVWESDTNVELTGEDRMVDGKAPQDAGVTGVVVVVRQVADGARGGGDPISVAEVGQGNRCCAHQGAIAGGVAVALREPARARFERRRGGGS